MRRRAARRARAPGAAVHAHGRARVTPAQLPYSWHRGLPGRARSAPAPCRSLLGLRRQGSHGCAGRQRRRGERSRPHVFARLYAARFLIRRMRPIDAYRGRDEPSPRGGQHCGLQLPVRRWRQGPSAGRRTRSAARSTSTPSRTRTSRAAGCTRAAGAASLDRSRAKRPGMAVRGGLLVRAFAGVGWAWGGRWAELARLPALLRNRRHEMA